MRIDAMISRMRLAVRIVAIDGELGLGNAMKLDKLPKM
jgi:hypothetical protein